MIFSLHAKGTSMPLRRQSALLIIEVSCDGTVHHMIDRMVSEHWKAYTEYEIRIVFDMGLWPYYSMNYVNVPRAIFTLAARSPPAKFARHLPRLQRITTLEVCVHLEISDC